MVFLLPCAPFNIVSSFSKPSCPFTFLTLSSLHFLLWLLFCFLFRFVFLLPLPVAPEILSSALFSPLSTLSPGMANSSLSYRSFLPLLSPPWPLVFLDTSTWVAFEYLTLSMCSTECVSSSSSSSCLLLFDSMLCPQSSKEVYYFLIFIYLFVWLL